jgi:hypothetical protein
MCKCNVNLSTSLSLFCLGLTFAIMYNMHVLYVNDMDCVHTHNMQHLEKMQQDIYTYLKYYLPYSIIRKIDVFNHMANM